MVNNVVTLESVLFNTYSVYGGFKVLALSGPELSSSAVAAILELLLAVPEWAIGVLSGAVLYGLVVFLI